MDPLLFLHTSQPVMRQLMLDIALAQEELRRRDAKFLVVQIARMLKGE